jgi:hypothetical protein
VGPRGFPSREFPTSAILKGVHPLSVHVDLWQKISIQTSITPSDI